MKIARQRGYGKSFDPSSSSNTKFQNSKLLAAIDEATDGQPKDFVISRLNHPEIIGMILGEIADKIEETLPPT